MPGNDVSLPRITNDRERQAREFIQRVWRPSDARQVDMFMLEGYTEAMGTGACACVSEAVNVGTKRNCQQRASVKARKGVWKRYGAVTLPSLAPVALRLLCVHPTSASTERCW
jgi:hypothetical protein